ncbi:MAG: hypothetical protein ACXVWV_00925 [Nocardioides sp.]
MRVVPGSRPPSCLADLEGRARAAFGNSITSERIACAGRAYYQAEVDRASMTMQFWPAFIGILVPIGVGLVALAGGLHEIAPAVVEAVVLLCGGGFVALVYAVGHRVSVERRHQLASTWCAKNGW